MLRKIRLTLAILFFALVTLLFLDFTGTAHAWFGWMAKIQFLPAVLALNVGVVALLIVLTLAFGRIYCSIICPLGVLQDIVAWIGKKQKKEPVPLFQSRELVALWRVGIVCGGTYCRNRFAGGITCSLQFLRTHGKQSSATAVAMG